MAEGPIRARWFDGRSSQAVPVLLAIEASASGPSLALHEIGGTNRRLKLASREVDWPQAWHAGARDGGLTIDLGDAGSLQVDDAAACRAAFDQAGGRAPLAQRMQTRWSVFVAVLAAAALSLAAFYRWGTPWAATQITREVPLAWELSVADRALSDLDGRLLQPSQLDAQRQARLRRRFERLVEGIDPALQRYPGYAPRFKLEFRSGMKPNAFALPGGTIVMLDSLVREADDRKLGDDALVGVLAHEAGHVVNRHTTRLVVEQAVLNVALGLAMGDVSSLMSVATSALTGLAYRRNHESEADCFASSLMRRADVPAAPMADLLLGLDGAHGAGGVPAFLSSHPATAERAQALKRGDLSACSG